MRGKNFLNAILAFSLLTFASTMVVAEVVADTKDSIMLKSTSKEESGQPKVRGAEKDKPRGQLLYETHCGACHDTSVHGRNPRKADSIGKIKYWVTRWSKELKLNWSTSDIDEVTGFVNSKYYHYKK